MILDKVERLKIFKDRLAIAPAAGTMSEAMQLLKQVLDDVENEFSGLPYNPEAMLDDQRMYAPREDNRNAVPGRPDLLRCRSRSHNTYFASNGAIKIISLSGHVWLDKPGVDGGVVGST